jgi:hypothetical protein
MIDDDRERQLARDLADILDRRASATSTPELAPELAALAEIDRVLDSSDALPNRLSGHRILSEIGAGGMGRVLLAQDEALGRKVAIKTLAPRYAEDLVLRARFMQEARAMARLSHPNIVRIYNLGPGDEPPHFVMELLDGAPLTGAAARLSFEQKAELLHKVVLAVDFLHAAGIVHRDLKPGNILAGPDLEPKLLDFGLALDLGRRERLSKAGDIAGTPEYLSPEQAAGAENLDARTDIFSLGAVLYEMLTGAPPFTAATTAELLRRIREEDAVPPRRLNPKVPEGLQNICMKALEKDPSLRYATAREMADDLRRYLAGEPVLAIPAAYTRLIAAQVERHLADIDGWRRDRIVSEAEYDGFRKRYRGLLERDDAWILEARRLTVPQVTLYLGAWVLAVGASMMMFFPYTALAGWPAAMVAWGSALPLLWIGIRDWNRGYFRVAIAYMIAFCLVTPVAAVVTFEEFGWFTQFTQGRIALELFHRLEFPKQATNAQIWWALLAGLPGGWALRRYTRAPVFSLMLAVLVASLCGVTLLRMGLIDWIEHDPGHAYFRLLPFAALFLGAGLLIERLKLPDDSRYFYPFGVAFTWAALSGIATYYHPYAHWLGSVAPWTRGQIEYLFIINAGLYYLLGRLCDAIDTAQMRSIATAFRFVIPGHVMTSLFLLGLNAKSQTEARTLEWLLPAVACFFVYRSISRQMKNYFVAGLVFFAAGIFRLQDQVFPNVARLPLVLLSAGLALMILATNYAPIRVALAKYFRVKS